MGYVIEFRDEEQYGDLMSKMHKAKKAVCEAFEELERADSTRMSERDGHYRGDYRRGSYRDDEMHERRGRDGMGRYV